MPLDDLGFRDGIGPLDKIERVIEFLAQKENWCKGALVTADGRRCIMGAVKEVDRDGVLVLPILTAIRQVTSRRFAQIEPFNDDPATTHPLVLDVLFRTRENIIGAIARHRCARSRPSRWWKNALAKRWPRVRPPLVEVAPDRRRSAAV